MDLFWNAGEVKTIGGVDLLGLRQVDQDLEAVWVAGVTTTSRSYVPSPARPDAPA